MTAKEAQQLANKNKGGALMLELQRGIQIRAERGYLDMAYTPMQIYADTEAADCCTKLESLGYKANYKRMQWNEQLLFQIDWYADEQEAV